METLFNVLTGLSHRGVLVAATGIWLGALLAALAWLMWRTSKTMNAATGHVIWWVVLAMVFITPFLAIGRLTGSPDHSAERSVQQVSAPDSRLALSTEPAGAEESNLPLTPATIAHAPKTPRSSIMGTLPAETTPAAVTQLQSGNDNADRPSLLSLAARLLPVSLLAIWFCICAALLYRLWQAHRRMVAIKQSSTPFDFGRLTRIDDLLQDARIGRPVRVRLSREVGCPVAAGLGDPTILLPETVASQLTERELEAAILHELAHIQRWDDWTKLAQRIIEALLFFNPTVRWIGRRLDLEREIACDDHVVERIGRPAEYARCLTRLTQLATMPTGSLIPGVLTSRKQIFRRFDQLLNPNRKSSTRLSRPRLLGTVTAIVAVVVVAARVVPVVALPVEVVTFDEFSGTVQSLAESVFAGAVVETESEEPQTAKKPEPRTIGALRIEDVETAAKDPVEPDPRPAVEPSTSACPSSRIEIPSAASGRAVFAVAEEPAPAEPAASPEPRERVVNWNDKVFDLPITGTIHGSDGEDGVLDLWIDNNQKVRAASRGRIRFTDDNRTIRSISRDGFLAIKEQHGTVWKELDIWRGEGRKLEYAYYEDGEARAFDDHARKWLARILRRMNAGVPGVPVPAPPDSPGPLLEGGTLIGRIVDWVSDPFGGNVQGMFSSKNDGERTISWSDGRDKLKVKTYGEVEFTDDDRAIKGISRRGYFAIREKRGSHRRELDVEPDGQGDLEYAYFVDGKRREFDAEGQAWLADVLIDVIHKTGVGAEARIARIIESEGVDGVLAEINDIESDYVKRIYFDAALNSEQLDTEGYARVLRQVGREIESDYEKAEILIHVAELIGHKPALIDDYVDVVATIDSDYETRRALSEVSMGDDVAPEVTLAVLTIAGEMDSDYEKAELLISMAPYCLTNGKLQQTYVDAVVDVDSDYESRRILSALTLDADVDIEIITTVLEIAGQMDSDYEKAELLIAMAPYCHAGGRLQALYVDAVIGLYSDYESRRVLSALGVDHRADPEIIITVLEIAAHLDSDYERAEILIEIAPYICDKVRARRAYLAAASELDSDYEAKRTLNEFINSCEMDQDIILAILPTVERMSSDYDKGVVLGRLAKYCRNSEILEEAFLGTVESMDSEYEIERLYTQLYRKNRRSRGVR